MFSASYMQQTAFITAGKCLLRHIDIIKEGFPSGVLQWKEKFFKIETPTLVCYGEGLW